MRSTNVHDPVFDRLVTGDYEITYNLFFRIREDENALVWTDDEKCIIAQSNPNTQPWIALFGEPDDRLCEDVAGVIAERFALNPKLAVTVDPVLGAGILRCAEKLLGRTATVKMPMNAYGCRATNDLPVHGVATRSTQEDVPTLAVLLQQDSYDAEGIPVPDEEALAWARAKAGSDRLFLWRDGETVAMACIAHETDRYARIAPVVTERAYRGKGYAPMLVKHVADALLSRGVTPMLYADAQNPSSNRAYRKTGFVCAGQVTTFIFT